MDRDGVIFFRPMVALLHQSTLIGLVLIMPTALLMISPVISLYLTGMVIEVSYSQKHCEMSKAEESSGVWIAMNGNRQEEKLKAVKEKAQVFAAQISTNKVSRNDTLFTYKIPLSCGAPGNDQGYPLRLSRFGLSTPPPPHPPSLALSPQWGQVSLYLAVELVHSMRPLQIRGFYWNLFFFRTQWRRGHCSSHLGWM